MSFISGNWMTMTNVAMTNMIRDLVVLYLLVNQFHL